MSNPKKININTNPNNKPSSIYEPRSEPIVYGELVVLGYNGTIAPYRSNEGTRKSKYVIKKRKSPNGIRVTSSYRYRDKQRPVPPGENRYHIVLEKKNGITLVQEYSPDPRYDIYQAGRYKTDPIDIHVNETVPDFQREERSLRVDEKSTVSRFACRFLLERIPPYTAYHEKQRMPWDDDMDVDGFTPNGVLLLHPSTPEFPGVAQWRELSVIGNSYSSEGVWIPESRNILEDCTLIDLNGVVLIWRSVIELEKGMTQPSFDQYIEDFNSKLYKCDSSKCHLKFSKCESPNENPWINFDCGHISCNVCSSPIREIMGPTYDRVQSSDLGLGNTNPSSNQNRNYVRVCPVCQLESKCTQLRLGVETSLYIGNEPLEYCFLPCGHVSNKSTVRFWSELQIRLVKFFTVRQCPFCAYPLDKENKTYTKINVEVDHYNTD
ncbi:E3 ubiquitin-protein ligase pellino [Intoshia linei]|uniref:E3 ubiquitin-protein ligase pellino n=1 Tax=Intoshia linei TaxID=1819745 RepID=A0A177BCQ1_9BILA|nr:E3 ubiquitin-protein ligase pellino [Intoshia linei]